MRLPTGTWLSYSYTVLCNLHIHVYFQIFISKSECNIACIRSFGNFNAGLDHNLSVVLGSILFLSCMLTTSGTTNIIITSRWAKCYITFISLVLLTTNLDNKRVWDSNHTTYDDSLLPNIFKWA